ncbi:unnamed protein product, partial [Closterium sp. NIES-53]
APLPTRTTTSLASHGAIGSSARLAASAAAARPAAAAAARSGRLDVCRRRAEPHWQSGYVRPSRLRAGHSEHKDAIEPVTYVPATHSLTFGPRYVASVNTATNPPSLAVVDSTCAPVAPTSNAARSATVAGYTAHPNGTITGPGGLSIFLGSGTDALFAMGTTKVMRNGTIVDGSGMKLVLAKSPNEDGSYTAGDMTGWPNGTIVGSGSAMINAGVPLTLTADGSIAFAPQAAPPMPGTAISVNPTARSLSEGSYMVSLSGNKLSLLDSSGKPITTTTNPNGSRSLGNCCNFKIYATYIG